MQFKLLLLLLVSIISEYFFLFFKRYFKGFFLCIKTLPIAVVLSAITVYEVCIMSPFQAKLPKLAILSTIYTCRRLLSGACVP